MAIQKLTMAAGLLWLVLNFALVRALERRDKRAGNISSRLGLAAALAAAKTVRTSAAYAALVFGSLWLVVLFAGRHSTLDLETLRVAATRVAAVKKWSDQFGSAWSWGVLGVSIFSLIWLARRGAKREVELKFERALGKRIGALVQLRESGELEELPPSPEMIKLLELGVALVERRESHLRDGVMTQLVDGQLHELEVRLSWLDLVRRIDQAELLAELEKPLPDRPTKAARVLASLGMSTALGKVGKGLAALASVLAMLSMVGVAGASARSALQGRAIELDELVIQASDIGLKERFDHALGAVQKQTISKQDRALAQYLAQRLERALVRADEWNRQRDANNQETRRHEVRRQLLTLASRRAPQAVRVTWEAVKDTAHVPHPTAAVKELPALSTEPVTSSSLGKRIESDLLSIAERSPSTWSRLRSRFDAQTAKFAEAASLGDVAGSLLGESIGQALSGVVGSPDSIGGILAKDVLKAVSKKTLDRWYREKLHAYVTSLGQGGSLEEATAQAMHGVPGYKSLTNDDAAALREVFLRELPPNETIAGGLGHPALVSATDPTLAEEVKAWGKTASPLDIHRSAALDTYDELFPNSSEAALDTLRGKLVQARGLTQSLDELAVERARNFEMLDSYNRIGGVVIGREPKGDALDIRNISWNPSGRGGTLALTDATGRTAIIHTQEESLLFLAAVYAADGRAATVTIINAGDVAAQKVHLHPSLLGTALGCRAIQLDSLVFSRISSQAVWKKAARDVMLDQSLYAETALTALRNTYPSNPAIKLEPFADLLENYDRASDGVSPRLALLAMHSELGFNSSPVEGTKDIYNPMLVGVMRLCSGQGTTLQSFRKCVQQNDATQRWGTVVWQTLISNLKEYCPGSDPYCPWRIITHQLVFPESSTVSGVREKEYTLRDLMSSTDERANGNLSPLHFLIQVVFAPEMTNEEKSDPWRFPALGEYAEDEVRKVAGEPQTAKLLSEFKEFTQLQRVFRAALNGKLGDRFPLEQMVDIANQTAASVTPAVVPTWINVQTTHDPNHSLHKALRVTGPETDASLTCPPL